jgi:hypothetical protein
LKLKALIKRTEVRAVLVMDGRLLRRASIRNERIMYEKMRIDQRSWGCVTTKLLTMSGLPANFWPVWFQALVIRRAAREMNNQPMSSRLLSLSLG